MTSWRFMVLFVFLCTIDLSEANCNNYFEILEWARNLTDVIYPVKTKDSKDVIECTIERECLMQRNICHILHHCFHRGRVKGISEKCHGDRQDSFVPFYHFMCLAAKASNHTPKGCKYETACNLYSGKAVLDQTTTLPPPPTTTTQPATTTTTTTTATTTVLPPKTTTTATTLPPPSTTVTQSTVSGSNGKHLKIEDRTDNTDSVLKTLLMMSVVLHVLVPLAVYLYMSHQRRQDRRQWMNNVSNGASTGAKPSNTPLAVANGDEVETSHLIQLHSVMTYSPDIMNDCAVGNEAPH